MKNLFLFITFLLLVFTDGDHPKGGYKDERKPRSKDEFFLG